MRNIDQCIDPTTIFSSTLRVKMGCLFDCTREGGEPFKQAKRGALLVMPGITAQSRSPNCPRKVPLQQVTGSRTVSCGPELPLVISPPAVYNRINIAIRYRTTGFSQGKIEGIMDSFVGQLESLPGHIEHGRPAGRSPCEVHAA
jgi:hypothetical protein